MTREERRAAHLETVYHYAGDVAGSDLLKREEEVPQHGSVSCYQHSLAVTVMSVRLASSRRLRVDMESMIKGALLHDYYLYDWRKEDTTRREHGFGHARRALANADRDFELTPIARDVIEKHMFPLNPEMPRYKESVVVSVADKICATKEVCRFLSAKAKDTAARRRFAPQAAGR